MRPGAGQEADVQEPTWLLSIVPRSLPSCAGQAPTRPEEQTDLVDTARAGVGSRDGEAAIRGCRRLGAGARAFPVRGSGQGRRG
jgi:hypothetical protein